MIFPSVYRLPAGGGSRREFPGGAMRKLAAEGSEGGELSFRYRGRNENLVFVARKLGGGLPADSTEKLVKIISHCVDTVRRLAERRFFRRVRGRQGRSNRLCQRVGISWIGGPFRQGLWRVAWTGPGGERRAYPSPRFASCGSRAEAPSGRAVWRSSSMELSERCSDV